MCAYGFFYEFYSIKFRSVIYEIVGWHHQCNGHKFGQTPGDGERQGALECCSPQDSEESDITWRLNNNIYALLWALLHMVKCLGLSSSFFLHVYIQFFQYYLLKRLAFLYWIVFTSLSKVGWPYLCGSISGYIWTLSSDFTDLCIYL